MKKLLLSIFALAIYSVSFSQLTAVDLINDAPNGSGIVILFDVVAGDETACPSDLDFVLPNETLGPQDADEYTATEVSMSANRVFQLRFKVGMSSYDLSLCSSNDDGYVEWVQEGTSDEYTMRATLDYTNHTVNVSATVIE